MSKKKERGEENVLPGEGGTEAAASGAPPRPASAPSAEPAEAAGSDAAAGAADAARTALEAEVAGLRDRLLRTQADFDNFRKRMLREREESARYANAALLSDLLAVIDDFERAIRSAEESRNFAVFLEGVSMIERRMLEMLENRWGLRRFSAIGEAFDPVRHEAMLRTERPATADTQPSGPVVVEEFQKGYYLHERVLRPAKVRVQVPAEGGSPAAGAPGPSLDTAKGPAEGPARGPG